MKAHFWLYDVKRTDPPTYAASITLLSIALLVIREHEVGVACADRVRQQSKEHCGQRSDKWRHLTSQYAASLLVAC